MEAKKQQQQQQQPDQSICNVYTCCYMATRSELSATSLAASRQTSFRGLPLQNATTG